VRFVSRRAATLFGGVALLFTFSVSHASPLRAQGTGGERPSWVIGGVYPVGMLVPLSQDWVIRPDLTASGYHQPLFDDRGWTAGGGVSVLRRSRPTEAAWGFGAIRYGFEVSQEGASPPRRNHLLSITLGGHAALGGRLGLLAETGVMFRHFQQGPVPPLFPSRRIGHSIVGVSRVGLTLRWKDEPR